jgi:hypothetical protein
VEMLQRINQRQQEAAFCCNLPDIWQWVLSTNSTMSSLVAFSSFPSQREWPFLYHCLL